MPQLDAPPPRAPAPVSDLDCQLNASVVRPLSRSLEADELEVQLGEVIRSARDVAASAEELLREIAMRQQILRTGRGTLSPLLIDQGLRFLDAMRLRLQRALDGLPLH